MSTHIAPADPLVALLALGQAEQTYRQAQERAIAEAAAIRGSDANRGPLRGYLAEAREARDYLRALLMVHRQTLIEALRLTTDLDRLDAKTPMALGLPSGVHDEPS